MSDTEAVADLSSPEVVQCYRAAADITNFALSAVLKACIPNAKVLDLCVLGDKVIIERLEKIYKDSDKGIAFPTSVSVNNICGHFCPLASDPQVPLRAGDVVKISLGTHINGFAVLSSHTVIVQSEKKVEITDRRADVITAAHVALNAIKRMIRPGVKNTEVTNIVQKVAEAYGVHALEGVLYHEMKQYVVDGENVIVQVPSKDLTVKEFTFEENQVFSLDVIMSTGTGKPVLRDTKTTIYKRSLDAQYYLKLASSRALFAEINKKAPTFPFSLRTIMNDEKKARLGINEMLQHSLLDSYPVLYEGNEEFVAHFQSTVLVMKGQTNSLTELNMAENIKSTKTCEDADVKAVLALSTKKKNKKKKKKVVAETTVEAEKETEK